MFRTRRWLNSALLTTLLLALFVVVGCTDDSKESPTEVVATYKGGQVTREEMDKQYHFQRTLLQPQFPDTDDYKSEFLDEYITLQKVMLEKAKSEGIKIDESQVAGAIQEYKRQVTELVYNNDKAKFEEQLKKFGITDEDIKQYVIADETLRLYRAAKIKDVATTDAEVAEYFKNNSADFATGTVWHILVKTEDEAKRVKERLGKGEDFELLAKELSQDPTAQQNGGKMEEVQFGVFVGPFRDAAAKLELKTYSEPVQTEYGWHIIRVEKRDVPAFESVKADAVQKLKTQKENTAWDQIYEETHQAAEIHVTLK